MKKKLMAVLGALSLVACGGSGKPWSGDDGPIPDQGWPTTGPGIATGGSEPSSVGGYEAGGNFGVAGSGAVGGYEAGGSFAVGGYEAGGNFGVAGYEAGGSFAVSGAVGGYESGGSYGSAGTGYGGFTSGGTGSQGSNCLQNVVHCFDAAANCYEYSPWSDCDQIVDVCAAMQMDCNE